MPDWPRIVELHGPIVWKTAYRLLNHEADVHDCFQETFVSALNLSREQSVENWPGLLKRLATTRALDRLRQCYRQSNRLDPLPEGPVADHTAADPRHAAEADEFADALRLAIANLDAQQADVFCLACLEGLAYQEIADALDITVNHVGVLLNRAKTNLREQLQAFAPGA